MNSTCPNVWNLKTVQETKDWIEKVMRCSKEESEDGDNEDDDDTQPSDSISEIISCTQEKKTSSVLSHSSQVSNASSARLKLETECEDLLACAAFLKKTQDIEMEEARLKACKEQLEQKAKIAASDAKIKVYADKGGQDGMNEYYSTSQKSSTEQV